MSIPFFGIMYAAAGSASIVSGFRKEKTRALQALGVMLFLVGLFNVYIEEWRNLKGLDFKSVALLLLLGLLLSYTALILCLMEQLGINKRRAFGYSFLPIVYALAMGLAVALPDPKTEENPPLVVYIFIVLILVIHIPAFAFGKSQAIKTQGQLANRIDSDTTDYPTMLWRPLLTLGAPLLGTFAIQTLARDDWRLFGSDFVFTAAITCLLVIGRNRTNTPPKLIQS